MDATQGAPIDLRVERGAITGEREARALSDCAFVCGAGGKVVFLEHVEHFDEAWLIR